LLGSVTKKWLVKTHWKGLLYSVVRRRAHELARALQLLVVTICKCAINPVTNRNPVYSHSYTWQYSWEAYNRSTSQKFPALYMNRRCIISIIDNVTNTSLEHFYHYTINNCKITMWTLQVGVTVASLSQCITMKFCGIIFVDRKNILFEGIFLSVQWKKITSVAVWNRLSHFKWLDAGFGLVTGFITHLQLGITCSINAAQITITLIFWVCCSLH
jgi:hypothetical protein